MTLAAEPWDFAGVMTVVNRPENKRLFTITLVLSVAVHLAAIAVAPRVSKPGEVPPRPLEVVIVQPPVPKPVRPETPRPPPPPERVVPKPQPQVQRTPTVAPQPAAPPKPVLALPESAAPSQPTFTVSPPTAAPPAPGAEPKVAAAPPSPPAPAREPLATPPDFNAAYLRNAPPRYPLIARRNGVEGTVRLKVFVSRDGRAGQVQLDRSSGSSALDTAAVEAVKNWQFVPARRGDEIIESWVIVPLVFKLEGTS
jgi:protein TonB